MLPSRRIFEALGHLNSFRNTIIQTKHNRSTERNIATLLTEKMFTNYNS